MEIFESVYFSFNQYITSILLFRGTHKSIVGSYGGGTKSTITRGNSGKVGGICKTMNYDASVKLEDKIIEGRDLLFDMMAKLKDNMKDMSATDLYDMMLVSFITHTMLCLSNSF